MKNMHKLNKLAAPALIVAAVLVGRVGLVQADSLDKIYQVGQAKVEDSQASQQEVQKIADQTWDTFQEYKTVLKQIEGLKVYNARLDGQIANQERRIANFEKAIAEAAAVKRQILPLVERMIDALEAFVAADMPFDMGEREQRIAFLRANLEQSNQSDAEKFRQVLEAYKIENEYGRFIETYKDRIEIEGSEREVNIFRVGRVGLMFQTTDAELTGAWNQAERRWEVLPSGEYKNAVRTGIRIAQKQAAIDIIKLPVGAPEAVN